MVNSLLVFYVKDTYLTLNYTAICCSKIYIPWFIQCFVKRKKETNKIHFFFYCNLLKKMKPAPCFSYSYFDLRQQNEQN